MNKLKFSPTIRYPYGKGRKNGLELVTYTSKFKILLGFVANYIHCVIIQGDFEEFVCLKLTLFIL